MTPEHALLAASAALASCVGRARQEPTILLCGGEACDAIAPFCDSLSDGRRTLNGVPVEIRPAMTGFVALGSKPDEWPGGRRVSLAESIGKGARG